MIRISLNFCDLQLKRTRSDVCCSWYMQHAQWDMELGQAVSRLTSEDQAASDHSSSNSASTSNDSEPHRTESNASERFGSDHAMTAYKVRLFLA